MKPLKNLLKATALAVPLAIGSMAHAAVISTSGGVINFTWSHVVENEGTITGEGSIEANLSGANLVLDVFLKNTTSGTGGDSVRLTAFGFGITPDATGVSIDDGDFMKFASLDQNFPEFQTVEVCAFSGSVCSAANGGIEAGDDDRFLLTLTGTWGSSVTLDPIAVRFAGDWSSHTFSVDEPNGPPPPPPPGQIPEPSTLAIFGLGLLALFGARRRRVMA